MEVKSALLLVGGDNFCEVGKTMGTNVILIFTLVFKITKEVDCSLFCDGAPVREFLCDGAPVMTREMLIFGAIKCKKDTHIHNKGG